MNVHSHFTTVWGQLFGSLLLNDCFDYGVNVYECTN